MEGSLRSGEWEGSLSSGLSSYCDEVRDGMVLHETGPSSVLLPAPSPE